VFQASLIFVSPALTFSPERLAIQISRPIYRDRYSYPRQDTEVGDGDALHLPDGTNWRASITECATI
jgi:hypothetical protein